MTTHEQARKEPTMTDKQQMREAFEACYRRTYPSADLGRDAAGDYTNGVVIIQWDTWQAAFCWRGAEVQALREALEKIVELSRKPLNGGFEFALAFTAAEKVARAALAGGETGDEE